MINNNIIKNRKKLGISQRELGRRSGISGQMVSKIENDITKPSLETLKKIAVALEVSLSEILGDEVTTYKIDEAGELVETNDIETKNNASIFLYNQKHGNDIGLPWTKENYKLDKSRFFVDTFSKYVNEIDNDALKLIISNIEDLEILKTASEYINAQIDLLEGNMEF